MVSTRHDELYNGPHRSGSKSRQFAGPARRRSAHPMGEERMINQARNAGHGTRSRAGLTICFLGLLSAVSLGCQGKCDALSDTCDKCTDNDLKTECIAVV